MGAMSEASIAIYNAWCDNNQSMDARVLYEALNGAYSLELIQSWIDSCGWQDYEELDEEPEEDVYYPTDM